MFDAEIGEAEFPTEPAEFADKIDVNAPERKKLQTFGQQLTLFLRQAASSQN